MQRYPTDMEVELTNTRVVAVDGGTATGKSRLVEELATLLRLKGVPVIHVSSGHLYRAVAYVALEKTRGKAAAVRQMSAEVLLRQAKEHQIEMHGGVVWIDGTVASVDDQLKAPGIGAVTPHGAAFPDVRDYVNGAIRRQVNEFDGYVMIDGRDIGAGVVPDAPLKLLLTVSPEVAAQRSSEHTIDEIVVRDEADRNREHGPLPRPETVHESVIVMPTDSHSPESARDEAYRLMREVFPELPEL